MLKVSVIVPVYNVSNFLRKCLDSLVKQIYTNYEIILVDDGSTDDCGQICNRYGCDYTKIKTVHQKNGGVSAARNTGLQMATGDVIAFVDPDDWVDADYLSTLVENMCPGGMSVCSFVYERDGQAKVCDNSSPPKICLSRLEAERSVLYYNGMGGYVFLKLFDKKIIDQFHLRFNESISICEDRLFTIQYLSHTENDIVWVKKHVYHYRIHSKSVLQSYYRKREIFSPKLFSKISAIELEMQNAEPDKLIQKMLKADLIITKRGAIRLMEINGWQGIDEYKNWLHDIRRNIFSFLFSNNRQRLSVKISILLCCIHPKLEYMVWKKLSLGS